MSTLANQHLSITKKLKNTFKKQPKKKSVTEINKVIKYLDSSGKVIAIEKKD